MSDRTIWKFPFSAGPVTMVEIPASAQVRLVGMDPASGHPAIWVELDPAADRIARCFSVYGTGHKIAGDGGYPYPLHVGSVIDGEFVWHIFEERS